MMLRNKRRSEEIERDLELVKKLKNVQILKKVMENITNNLSNEAQKKDQECQCSSEGISTRSVSVSYATDYCDINTIYIKRGHPNPQDIIDIIDINRDREKETWDKIVAFKFEAEDGKFPSFFSSAKPNIAQKHFVIRKISLCSSHRTEY